MGIKLKMTLWYTILALVTAGLMGGLLFIAAQRSAYEYYSDTLHAASALAQSQLEYESGNLEIDDDLEDIPDVHIALYTESGTLIYGRTRVELAFEQDAVRRVSSGGMEWYALDTLLTFAGRSSVWMRCVKAADSEAAAYVLVLRAALILLPLMIGLTALGGFLIARGAFRPVGRMAATAEAIVSGGDLGRRVGLHGGRDELTRLSRTLDSMLERLDEAFRRERQFTSDAAHELRTPLNAVRLLCQEAMDETDPGRRESLIAEIMERIDGLSRLVAQLLALSRMDAGCVPVEMREVDVSRLMQEVAHELEPLAQDADISLEAQVEPGVRMNADASLLTRLAVNLLGNAIRYGRRGGHAWLKLTDEADGVCLAVRDDGVGMSPEEQERMWDRFWRADSSRNSEGTGLGLAIARWIIDRHGGTAQVRSAPGKGTEIRVVFPRK